MRWPTALDWRSRDTTGSGSPGLVASGLGDDTGGGVYELEGDRFVAIDDVSTTGLAISADARRLARLCWSQDQSESPGTALVYDSSGLLAHHRLDELQQPHSALWDGNLLVVVSTGTNSILWVDSSGTVRRRWSAPGDGDCWHLNSLTTYRGKLLISAFGRFPKPHQWVDRDARDGTGVVVDVQSGRNLLHGFSAPHNPLWVDGGWLICNSGNGELCRLDTSGKVVERRGFSGWTRGLTYDDSLVYVGVSAHRLRGADNETAAVVALTRIGLEEVERWSLPCREIYDLLITPKSLLDGLRKGRAQRSLSVATP